MRTTRHLWLWLLLWCVFFPALAQKPHNRAEATETVRELRKIVAPGGVERSEVIQIGGYGSS